METHFSSAALLASSLDEKIPSGFITVKKVLPKTQKQGADGKPGSLMDSRVNDLIEVLSSRSRTSELQPSLKYVRDAAHAISVATSHRHNLIFGRRGVGKTALMLEAKRLVEERGNLTFWINVQTLRSLKANEAFLTIARRLCDLPAQVYGGRKRSPRSVERSNELREKIQIILSKGKVQALSVHRIIPELQEMLKLVMQESQENLYLFLDDFHYLAMNEQPSFLDMVHAITRDIPVWIKAAAIRHQARWFTDNPPTGLQTGHDAALINLDVTLEQPAKAKEFLKSILAAYAEEAKLLRVADIISGTALDRLVLASGGVPRDFLVLSATGIEVARQRPNAKTVGVQDVNEAAGRIEQVKIQELEEDAASSVGKATSRKRILTIISKFLLEEKHVTYFRVDFRDKELHQEEYEQLQSLMDLRLIHLIHAGLSDEHHAGQRSEVYMLDLSQFSGIRFRRNLKVLDFTNGHLVLKSTGGDEEPRWGDTSKRLWGILRRGPLFQLEKLSEN